MYDSEKIMTESQLPPIYVPKESKRIRLESITNRKQAKIRKDENINIPRSLFDKPSPFILKLRKEVKVQKLKNLINGGPDISQLQRILSNFGSNYTLPQPTTLQQQASLSKTPMFILNGTQQESQIHWGINEDWALVEIIQYIQELPINLLVLSPGYVNFPLILNLFVDYLSYHFLKFLCPFLLLLSPGI
jgi:E1A-binding protein p400